MKCSTEPCRTVRKRPASSYIKSGKLRPLALTAGQRHPYFPDIPTLKELGYEVEYYVWAGIFAPKDTPVGALKVLRDALRQAVADTSFKTAMETIQTPIVYKDADAFQAWLDVDAVKASKVIQRIGRVE